jgi:UDP-GlcNAc:undecaprenyl-phosphate/decaprenyl-phosphate GlcNAc-1-phosphate transferase
MNDLDALWAFLVAGVVAFTLTPLAARLAHRVGAIDRPGERSLHASPTPSLGGLAILAGVLLAGALFLPSGEETRGLLAGAALIALIGAVDDALEDGLSPVVKLLGQAGAALIAVLSEVRVENLTLPFVDPVDLGDWGIPLTLLGIVAVMNVVNFTDGVDGLAAGVCTIAAVTFASIALSLDRVDAGVLAAATAGASAGFLWHNFHPASVFMGDSGSNLLGFLLACIAIQGVLKTAAVVALFFPLVILAVPALDATFVVAKRIKYGRPVYSADRWHFHHRFANIGFSQRRTVLYLYAWTVSLAALALALRFVPYSDDDGTLNAGWAAVILGFGLLAFAASLYLVLVLEILKFRRFRERQLRRKDMSEQEIEDEIQREVETGEFEALDPDGEPSDPDGGAPEDGSRDK